MPLDRTRGAAPSVTNWHVPSPRSGRISQVLSKSENVCKIWGRIVVSD
nr:MAG TPA: hypothetical protein [Caudoviricetes sp.]